MISSSYDFPFSLIHTSTTFSLFSPHSKGVESGWHTSIRNDCIGRLSLHQKKFYKSSLVSSSAFSTSFEIYSFPRRKRSVFRQHYLHPWLWSFTLVFLALAFVFRWFLLDLVKRWLYGSTVSG
ncbi:hypothetical protein P170DRAFT_236815 [Aspergillus steynii IBT 23096]|uniref:Uncharacterized protein n=1 Tax=Aspergillus steynii IBT 23096 TaxID=1392250 RepID=A0A2I2G2X8_9EURO|nr:uncharacterized protein P170DRAFT_236815 [Aspergillus steynii IBT 23096]PLB47221.1 hypothetical protein P170DRAFT_236815 [Aspergillus steynii IBT 23096]